MKVQLTTACLQHVHICWQWFLLRELVLSSCNMTQVSLDATDPPLI